jgi:hypothetical protein
VFDGVLGSMVGAMTLSRMEFGVCLWMV